MADETVPAGIGDVPTREDFDVGVTLAFAYVGAAIRADSNRPNDGIRAYYSTGVLAPFLEQLHKHPEWVAGFDAYLTELVGVLEHSTPCVDRIWLTHGYVYGPDFDFFDDGPRSNVVPFPARSGTSALISTT